MKATINVKCPYCGNTQRHHIKVSHFNHTVTKVLLCDQEEGGCDSEFAIKCCAQVIFETRKIEGEERE